MENFKFFLVKSKGITRQFTSQAGAFKLFNKVNRDLIADEETFHSKILGKENITDQWLLLDELRISKSYYTD